MVWPFSSNTPAPTAEKGGCPVDHDTRNEWNKHVTSCPVDHDTQTAYLAEARSNKSKTQAGPSDVKLSHEREISSIPRYYMETGEHAVSNHASVDELEDRDKNWVYPSPSQFYNAVRRKNHDARAEDMDIVVPIHNAVNEQAWRIIRDWESNWNECGAPKPELVNFIGRPRDYTWRAWMRSLAGYQLPFDRHDWIIVRPNERGEPKTMRYIIDFYAGRAPTASSSEALTKASDAQGKVSFYLDVRPAPDTFEGIAMRLHRWWLPSRNSTSS